jgi:hypothetical protein
MCGSHETLDLTRHSTCTRAAQVPFPIEMEVLAFPNASAEFRYRPRLGKIRDTEDRLRASV